MGSTEFQKELIAHLEDQNNKLRNTVAYMKENLEKILTKDSTKNELESLVYDVMNVCCAMTEEIDDLYEHFSATSAVLCSVLKRKSQMTQLSKKLATVLHSFEQIDPELELIDANNMACFAKRLSDGKNTNQKRGTAKVSPMINGLTISTDPRIRLNRVTHETTNRHRIAEAPQLSPVVEASPATTPARNQRQIFFREIQISVPRLNINSDGQVVNRNIEESPRSSNCDKKKKKPLATRLLNNSQQNRRSEPSVVAEEGNEELATEEEKENLNNTQSSGSEEVLRAVPSGENSDVEEDKEEEQCSLNSSTESSPESSKGKNKSLSSPEEPVDPLEGPSWLLDDRPSRRESGKGSSFKYVNVRRPRNRFFSGSSKDSLESQKLDTVVEQKEPEQIDSGQEEKNNQEKKIDLSSHDNLDTSDMEMTECLPVVRHDVNNQISKNQHSQEKAATPATDSSVEINSTVARSETSLDVTLRKRIEESSEEDDDENNITSAATYGSEGSKLRYISSNSGNLEDFSNINERTLKVVLEKRDSLESLARTESVKSLPSPKSSTKDRSSSETKIVDVKKIQNNTDSDRSSPHSPEKVEKAGNNNSTPLAPENQGRPKREAARRCMEQKVWILGTPDDDKNKNKNKNKNFKTKRKQDEADSSPNEKKKKHRSPKIDKEDESNIDSDTSTQDSVPSSPPPQNVKSTKTPNVENNRSVDQSLGGSASILPDDERKKKRKIGPLSSKFSTFDETNRTMDQSNVNASGVVEEEGRRKRRAAPVSLKEPSLNQKMRRNP